MAIKMMKHVPASMEKPSDTDEGIGAESLISAESHDGREGKLPYPEAAIEICCARTRDHNCIEVLPLWFR